VISLNTQILEGISFYLFNGFFFCVLLFTLYRSPWGKLKANLGLQHLCFGACIALIIIWSISADLSEGISIHFLGMTALCLILGWDLAIVCASVALTLIALANGDGWVNFAANGVLTILLPVAIAHSVMLWVTHKMPKNFFIYLFCCGFFCAGISAVAIGFAVSLTLWLHDVYPWIKIQQDIVTIIILTAFPEGLLNGMLLSAVMVFFPDWIRSFDARAYIDEQ